MATENIIQIAFWNCCTDNNLLMTKQYLEKYDNVNILYNDGSCFYSAIKYNNAKMLKLLIDYYMKNINLNSEKRSNLEKSTLEEIAHIHHLKIAIENIEEQIEIPEELKKIFYKYGLLDLDYSESEESLSDSDSEQSIEDFSFQVYDDNFPTGCSFQIYDGNEENWLDLLGQNSVNIMECQ